MFRKKLIHRITSKNLQYLCIIILVNLIYYTYIIYHLPDFYTDDYSIFCFVKEFLNNGRYPLFNEMHYLYWRPFTFLFFLIDYIIWGVNSVAIKFNTLLIHIVLVIIIYFTFDNLLNILKYNHSKIAVFFLTFTISVHPVRYEYMIWIAQKNALYMELFYVLSFFFIFKYINTNNYLYIFLSILSYCFSLLCKQNAASLPLIILITLFYLRHNIDQNTKRIFLYVFGSFFLITLLYSIIISLYFNDLNLYYFFTYIHKKPFLIVSSVLYFLFPYKIDKIYYFFIENHNFAYLVFLLIIIIFIYLFLKRYNLKYIIYSILLLTVSYFPQAITTNELRNLNIQILLLFFLIFLFLIKQNKKFIIYFILFLNGIYFLSISDNLKQDLKINEYYNYSIKLLINYKHLPNENAIVLALHDIRNLPYQYYFLKHNDFGKSDFTYSNIYFIIRNDKILSDNLETKIVTLSKKNNIITYKIIKNLAYLSYYNEQQITNEKLSISTRGYDQFSYIIPNYLLNKKLIYFDGFEWNLLNE